MDLKPSLERFDAGGQRRLVVVSALGLVEILTWGSSFYLPAVLAGPIMRDTGWPLAGVVGGLTLGLLVAAFASPHVGAAIQRRGGRPVLILAALLLASGLTIVALAPGLLVYLAGWLVMGLGMGCGLYDPAFATLGRLYGAEARPAITTLTLWGGFTSTICWPLSGFLVGQIGWRGTCLAYAGLHLVLTLPLVLALIPSVQTRREALGSAAFADAPFPVDRRLYLLFAGVLVLGGAVMSIVSVHLLALLQARGVPLTSAISYGALIGPAQVAARVIEMSNKGRHHPLWTLTAALSLIILGIGLLTAGIPGLGMWLLLYGSGNGIYSIARGTVPLVLFGPERYAVLVGRLARPGLVAQALAPSLGAFVLARGGADALFVLLVGLALTNLGLVVALWRVR